MTVQDIEVLMEALDLWAELGSKSERDELVSRSESIGGPKALVMMAVAKKLGLAVDQRVSDEANRHYEWMMARERHRHERATLLKARLIRLRDRLAAGEAWANIDLSQ